MSETDGFRRCTVIEAAELLGITERAVRKRIQVGTMRAERVEGRWTVLVPLGKSGSGTVDRPEPQRPVPEPRDSRWVPEPGPEPGPGPELVTRGRSGKGPERAEDGEGSTDPELEIKPGTGSEQEVGLSVPVGHASELLAMMRDLQRQNLELAGQVGFLQARLAATQEQLLLAEEGGDQEDDEEPEPVPEPNRSWLSRLFGA